MDGGDYIKVRANYLCTIVNIAYYLCTIENF